MREQQDYAQFRITAVINDLNSLDIMVGHGKKEMQLEGGIGYAPVVKNFKDYNLPILKDTMYHTIRGKDGCVLVELK